MNIIVGASGQIGSNLVPEKIVAENGIESRIADLFDLESLIKAFEGGTTVFLLTPEDPRSKDIIGDTKRIIENYRKAIQATGIKNIIGLSCIGAHVVGSTGNILMSRILEQAFDGLDLNKTFIRPSYYYSNWLAYLDAVKQQGILPSFFPEDLKIEMHSPVDVAKFAAKVIVDTDLSASQDFFELIGPQKYSTQDVAAVFSQLLSKDVCVHSIPQEKWKETLLSAGFTDSATANLADMTQAVIDQLTIPEKPADMVELPTDIKSYFSKQLDIQT